MLECNSYFLRKGCVNLFFFYFEIIARLSCRKLTYCLIIIVVFCDAEATLMAFKAEDSFTKTVQQSSAFTPSKQEIFILRFIRTGFDIT